MTSKQGSSLTLSLIRTTLVRPASSMAEHGTRRTTTDRLEEAITALTEKHSDLANKFEAICERLSHMTSSAPPPPSAP